MAAVKQTGAGSTADRAIAAAVKKARRQAAADGLKVPVQSLGDAEVRWIKP
jgi:hypothetical protein